MLAGLATRRVLSLRQTGGLPFRNMHLMRHQAYVNGRWVYAASNRNFEVFNPATGLPVGLAPDMDVADAQKAIEAASGAFECWRDTPAKERAKFLRKWFDLLEKNKESIARIMTIEAGKPLAESMGEIAYGNSFVEFYAEQARHIHGEIIPSPVASKKILVEKQPIGVAGLIAPWNFPHAMITRKAGAALAAGCTCVIRPSEDTPFTALALAELAQNAGIPDGVLNVVTSSRCGAGSIGKLFCESPLVAGVSFTGSTAVGKILYKQCSGGIKRLGLELGGNAPFIVYESASLDKALSGALAAKLRNCGQTCVSANRFLIHESLHDEFCYRLVEAVKQLQVGNGLQTGVQIGPLINKAQFCKVSAMVDDAVVKGAAVLTGGRALPDVGELFYAPTVLTSIKKDMLVYNDEIFGPVFSIAKFKTEEESLAIANATRSGLAGYFFSEDVNQIFRVSRKLEMGMIGVNEGAISTAEAPFGGVKESGLGREGSHHGTDEYLYIKYICMGGLC